MKKKKPGRPKKTATKNQISKKELAQIIKATKGIERAVITEIKKTDDLKLLKGIEKTSLLIQKNQEKILSMVTARITELGYH
jgi:hypothetical protein